jgi:hypothetical protein
MDIQGHHYLHPPSDRVQKPVQLKRSLIRMHEKLIVSYQGNDAQYAHQSAGDERSAEEFQNKSHHFR